MCNRCYKRTRLGTPATLALTDRAKSGARQAWVRWVATQAGGECREWPFPPATTGYGQLWYDGKKWSAHRLAFVLAGGVIPPGLHIRHMCNNPPCCLPEHLRPGTAKENMSDKVEHGTAPRGERQGSHKLTAAQVREIRADPRLLREVAEQYGIVISAVSAIRRRKSWAHVPD